MTLPRLAPAFVVILSGIVGALHIGKMPTAIPILREALGVTLVEAGFLLSMVQMAGMLVGVLIGLATAGHSGWMANLFSLVSDTFPKRAVASVTGIGTMAGALGGIFVARFAGWILDATGSYWPLFAMSASSYVVAWLLVHLLLPKKGSET